MQNEIVTMESSNALEATVRPQLQRILASAHFVRSQALSRLLQFLVEQTLEGRQHELKEYRLGVDVFQRGDEFDPRIDPIVRMQAAKLRARLSEYYTAEGRNDPMVISIQKGGYVPSFRQVESPTPAAPQSLTPPATDGRRTIAVLPFLSISADPENEVFCDGLTEELISVLVARPELSVVSRTSVFAFKRAAADIREIGARLGSERIIEGSVRRCGNQLRVTTQLVDVATGFQLQSCSYDRKLDDVLTLQDELALLVAAELAPAPSAAQARPFLVARNAIAA